MSLSLLTFNTQLRNPQCPQLRAPPAHSLSSHTRITHHLLSKNTKAVTALVLSVFASKPCHFWDGRRGVLDQRLVLTLIVYHSGSAPLSRMFLLSWEHTSSYVTVTEMKLQPCLWMSNCPDGLSGYSYLPHGYVQFELFPGVDNQSENSLWCFFKAFFKKIITTFHFAFQLDSKLCLWIHDTCMKLPLHRQQLGMI